MQITNRPIPPLGDAPLFFDELLLSENPFHTICVPYRKANVNPLVFQQSKKPISLWPFHILRVPGFK
jgi:hypothetical protein